MPWGIIASVAGPLIGGLLGGGASSDAANAQAQSAAAANSTQLQMYNQNRKDMEPWRRTGEGALNRLALLMGIPGNSYTSDQLRTRLLPQFTRIEQMPGQTISLPQSDGALDLGTINTQRQVVDEEGLAAAIQAELGRDSETYRNDPQFGSLTKRFGMSDFEADPGYNFRLSEGLKAMQNSAAARGSMMSGATMKGLQRFGQNLASDEYTNAFNRYQSQNANLYNRLAGLSGTGQVQSQQMAAQGANTAGILGQNIIGAGNAQAAGIVGRSNALSGAIGQGMNFYNQNRMLDMLNRGNGSSSWDTPAFGGFDPWSDIGSYYGGSNAQEMGY